MENIDPINLILMISKDNLKMLSGKITNSKEYFKMHNKPISNLIKIINNYGKDFNKILGKLIKEFLNINSESHNFKIKINSLKEKLINFK